MSWPPATFLPQKILCPLYPWNVEVDLLSKKKNKWAGVRKTNSRCLTISRLIFENLCYSYLHRNDVTIQPHFIMFISYCIYLSFGMKSKWSFSWWNYDSQLWLHFATLAIQMVNNPRVVQMPGFFSVTARLKWCFKTLLSYISWK